MISRKEYEMLVCVSQMVQSKVHDLTRKGHCSRCGGCCPDMLPLSLLEIETIQAYISEHGIKPEAPKSEACPFLNALKECNIYEVRPLICRLFKCNRPEPPFKHTKLLERDARDVVNVRAMFFGKSELPV